MDNDLGGKPAPKHGKSLCDTPTPIHEYSDRDEKGLKLALIYECRERWSDLQTTGNDQVRYCTNCSQSVFLVSDVNDFHRAAAAGRCIMVKPRGKREYLGGPASIETSTLNWDETPLNSRTREDRRND